MIVAVNGFAPSLPEFKRGQGAKNTVALPKNEKIVGFAFAGAFAYGLNALRTGRSKNSLELQLYVHPEYTRKGVGRNLLDRLIQCCSCAYA